VRGSGRKWGAEEVWHWGEGAQSSVGEEKEAVLLFLPCKLDQPRSTTLYAGANLSIIIIIIITGILCYAWHHHPALCSVILLNSALV
jgi:hypothetical protein